MPKGAKDAQDVGKNVKERNGNFSVPKFVRINQKDWSKTN